MARFNLPAWGSSSFVPFFGCTNGSVLGHLRGGDDPNAAADELRGDVRPVEGQRANEAQRFRIRDVDSARDGLRRRVRHHPAGHRRKRLRPVAAARENEQAVAVQEQLVARAWIELQRVQQGSASRR